MSGRFTTLTNLSKQAGISVKLGLAISFLYYLLFF